MTVDDTFVLPAPGADEVPAAPPGYRITETDHGTRVEGPCGGRLLRARTDAPAERPAADRAGDTGAGAGASVDVAIVDVVESPRTIGALRRSGIAGDATVIVAVGGDHRLRSPDELVRRARLWDVACPVDGQELSCPPADRGAGDATTLGDGPHRVLVTGGARSGKSSEAELRLLGAPVVTYLATGPTPGDDESWTRRVRTHQERRPGWWHTVETGELAAALEKMSGAGLVDCVGTWLAGEMERCGMWDDPVPSDAEDALASRVAELVTAWRDTSARVVGVTNEVGSGVVPATASGGAFRDHLGRLNQLLAAESEEVVLVTAGRAVELP